MVDVFFVGFCGGKSVLRLWLYLWYRCDGGVMPLSVAGWDPPSRMPAYTCLSAAVVDELSGVAGMAAASNGYNLFKRPVHRWPRGAIDVLLRELSVIGETGQARLLEADAEANGTEVRRSTVPRAGLGVFATRAMSVGDDILPFFGQIVYHDLQLPARSTRPRTSERLYGLDALPLPLATTARNWMFTGLQLRAHSSLWQSSSSYLQNAMVPTAVGSEWGLSSDAYPRPVWVVPADCCAAGRVNDPRPHLSANAKYVQRFDPVLFGDQLIKANCAFLVVTRDIKAGEEILAKYGRRYPLQVQAVPVGSTSGGV